MAIEMVKHTKEEKIYQFLVALDYDSYSIVRSQILALDPLLLIDKVINMIQ